MRNHERTRSDFVSGDKIAARPSGILTANKVAVNGRNTIGGALHMKLVESTKLIGICGAALLALTACTGTGSSDANNSDSAKSSSSSSGESSTNESSGDNSTGNGDCWVELFDSDNFDESDDHFKLKKDGEYQDLSDLPGADQDWTDEADSVKVGGDASVTVWSEKDFKGEEHQLKPGSEHPDLDEVSSLKMSC
jgi:hypothetical protein